MQESILFPRQGKNYIFFLTIYVSIMVFVIASLCIYVAIFLQINDRLVCAAPG